MAIQGARRFIPRRALAGFSLVELMVVVVIMGILSAIAIPIYSGSRRRAQAIEASEVLSRIVRAQEAYRAHFGAYSDVAHDETLTGMNENTAGSDPGDGVWWPRATTSTGQSFYGGLPLAWDQLGVRPRDTVRFSYKTFSGNANVTPSVGVSGDLGWSSLQPLERGLWFYAAARGDLNGDGIYSRFETSSLNPGIRVVTGRETD